MSVGVMKDYKLKLWKLRASLTQLIFRRPPPKGEEFLFLRICRFLDVFAVSSFFCEEGFPPPQTIDNERGKQEQKQSKKLTHLLR